MDFIIINNHTRNFEYISQQFIHLLSIFIAFKEASEHSLGI